MIVGNATRSSPGEGPRRYAETGVVQREEEKKKVADLFGFLGFSSSFLTSCFLLFCFSHWKPGGGDSVGGEACWLLASPTNEQKSIKTSIKKSRLKK